MFSGDAEIENIRYYVSASGRKKRGEAIRCPRKLGKVRDLRIV